jgi:hypothetical protein
MNETLPKISLIYFRGSTYTDNLARVNMCTSQVPGQKNRTFREEG